VWRARRDATRLVSAVAETATMRAAAHLGDTLNRHHERNIVILNVALNRSWITPIAKMSTFGEWAPGEGSVSVFWFAYVKMFDVALHLLEKNRESGLY
jgi:hypothetical protein